MVRFCRLPAVCVRGWRAIPPFRLAIGFCAIQYNQNAHDQEQDSMACHPVFDSQSRIVQEIGFVIRDKHHTQCDCVGGDQFV